MCKENVLYLLSLCFLVEAFKERGIISLIGGCQRFFKRICVRYINLTLSKLFFMLFLYSIFSAVNKYVHKKNFFAALSLRLVPG